MSIFLLSGCSTRVDQASEIKNPEYVYQGAGIEQYFLPELPVWANFSEASSCRRKNSVRYLDFSTLRQSYSLSYSELLHFQNMYNRKLAQFKNNNPTATLYLKDEAYIFNNTYQLLIGGGRDFLMPKYPKISLIWIDPYLKNKEKIKELLNDKEVVSGFPVLVTNCLSSAQIEKFIAKNKLDQYGIKFIGQEMFTPYSTKFELSYFYSLDFSKLFDNKEVTLFGRYNPRHFLGIKKFRKK